MIKVETNRENICTNIYNNINKLSDKQLMKIYRQYIYPITNSESKTERLHGSTRSDSTNQGIQGITTKEEHKNRVIDKTTKKYEKALNFINKVLKNIGKPEINDLLHFRNICKNEINSAQNIKMLKETIESFFPEFSKTKCSYYRQDSPAFVLNFIRGMCKEIGLEFKLKQKCSSVNSHIKMDTYYSIC